MLLLLLFVFAILVIIPGIVIFSSCFYLLYLGSLSGINSSMGRDGME
jgi:hypothetical protein